MLKPIHAYGKSKALAEKLVVVFVEFAAGMDADLVERPGQKIQASELVEGGDRAFFHGGSQARRKSEIKAAGSAARISASPTKMA